MATRSPFVIDEWYHCYSRGVDKRTVFEGPRDYERFMLLLYLCNGSNSVRISDLKEWNLQSILTDSSVDRGEPLVELGVYSLMSNHVHLVVQEIRAGGISLFMRKVFTGYTMYFNTKYSRTGALFSGAFKSKHVDSDEYLKLAVPYVLLNPAELFDDKWKEGKAIVSEIERRLLNYSYSSLLDFIDVKRPENVITGGVLRSYFERSPTLEEMISNAQEYYIENKSLFTR